MAHEHMSSEENLLADSLHSILNGTFEAGLGIAALAKFLEGHADEMTMLVGLLSKGALDKLKAACEKQITDSQ